MECKGFLFDLDGTLVDSLVAVERAWRDWAKSHNYDEQEVINFIHGKQAITALRHFMQGATEEEVHKEFLYIEEVESRDTEGISALPGARALLLRLNELNIPWAIVTSGSIPVAHARVKKAGLPIPKVFITAEQVKRGKPEPDAYLLGAAQLGFKPEECVAVEDAPAGLTSALAAGCQVIAVNAPAHKNTLDQVAKVLTSLTQVIISYHNGNVKLAFSV